MPNRSRKRLLAGSILFTVLAVAATSRAEGGLALDRFQPAPAGDRFFGVQGGDPGGELSPRLMLLGDYAYKPLVLYRGSGDAEIGTVVRHQLFFHLSAGISLWDRVWLSANLPLAIVNSGDSVDGAPPPPSGAAAGDLRLGLRVRLLGENRSLASLSLSGY